MPRQDFILGWSPGSEQACLSVEGQNQVVKTGKAPATQGNSAQTPAEHKLNQQRFSDHTQQGIVFVKIETLEKSQNKWTATSFNNKRKKEKKKNSKHWEGGESDFQSYLPIFNKKITRLTKNKKIWPIQRSKINLQKSSIRRSKHQSYQTNTLKLLP